MTSEQAADHPTASALPTLPSAPSAAVQAAAERAGGEAVLAFRAAQEAWHEALRAYADYQRVPPGPAQDDARWAFMSAMRIFLQRVRQLTAAIERRPRIAPPLPRRRTS